MKERKQGKIFYSVLRVPGGKKKKRPRRLSKEEVGVDYELEPPVPIPNTEVKQLYADNTWLATAREDT